MAFFILFIILAILTLDHWFGSCLKKTCIIDIVFYNNPVRFCIEESLIEEIDIIFYIIMKDEKNFEEKIYNKKIEKELNLNIPTSPVDYKISFEILLITGDSISKQLQIKKITEGNINEYNKKELVINTDNCKIDNKYVFDIYNPFINSNSKLILYNNDIYINIKDKY